MKFATDIFYTLSIYSIIVPIVTMILFWKRHYPRSKLICFYGVLALVFSFIIEYCAKVYHNNIWAINSYIILEFITLMYFFKSRAYSKKLSLLVLVILGCVTLFLVINIFVISGINKYDTLNMFVYASTLCIVSAMLIYQYVIDENHSNLRDPNLILSIGFFLYFSLLLLGFSITIDIEKSNPYHNIILLISNMSFGLANFQFNFIFAYSFYLSWNPSNQKQ